MSQETLGKGGGGDKPAIRVRSDIVFCIDVSDSMIPCIEGVKNNIRKFVDEIKSDPELNIDVRLGFLGHTSDHRTIKFYIKDFTTDVEEFKKALTGLSTEASEANLPALDWSLDFPWEREAHKFVVLFTDEPVDGGWDPAASRSKIPDLKKKIQDLGASVYFVTFERPEFGDYFQIAKQDKCATISVGHHGAFEAAKFEDLLSKIAKKVSTGSKGVVGLQRPIEKDIYKVRPIATIIKK